MPGKFVIDCMSTPVYTFSTDTALAVAVIVIKQDRVNTFAYC